MKQRPGKQKIAPAPAPKTAKGKPNDHKGKAEAKGKPAAEKKKVGRKPWVPDYEKIMQWALQGLTDKDIAALSGIDHRNFCEKKGELSELAKALAEGRAKGVAVVSQKLLQLALAGDRDLIKFYLSRRGGWIERLEIDNLNPTEMSTEELLALRDKLQNP